MVSSIKRVNLTGSCITAKGLRYLPSGLEELILCDCPKLGDDIITFLPRNISTLYLFNCPKITVNVELERPDVGQFKFCAPHRDYWSQWFESFDRPLWSPNKPLRQISSSMLPQCKSRTPDMLAFQEIATSDGGGMESPAVTRGAKRNYRTHFASS